MQSFQLHYSLSPFCSSIHIPNPQINKPKINQSSLHYSLPGESPFTNALHSLRTCTENENPKLGSCFHARILKLGLERDVFISNSLLNMYSKCDEIKHAGNVFDHMPHRTIVSWTSMMSGYCRNGLADETISLFLRMMEEYLQPNEFSLAVVLQACAVKGDQSLVKSIQCFGVKSGIILDEFLQNSLLDAYAKSGEFRAAEKLLRQMCSRDVVSWTSIISGCVSHGNVKGAIDLFCSMQEDGVFPNEVTMLSILQACSEINKLDIMQWIHGFALKWNWLTSGLVLNSLIEMYSMNGWLDESVLIFCDFCFNNDGLYPSRETMAKLCSNCESLKLGKEIHGYLIKHGFLPCTISENSLINMYSKNGCVDSALLLFRTMADRDIISWNTIVSCFVQNDEPVSALRLVKEIHEARSRENISPDFVTLLTSLQACSDLALLLQGQVIHGYATKTGLLGDIFIQNALIDMYAKSGKLDLAELVFEEMHERDIGSWNSIIAAYGTNGQGHSAFNIFSNLINSRAKNPNAITFVNVLSACAHAGLVKEGFQIFKSMEKDYGVTPSMVHFACMVDLLGRARRVDEAENFIHTMPVQPGPDVWGALLSACVLVGDVKVAEKAAKEIAALEPSSSIWRVALSNVYASAGQWDKVAHIRAELRGMRKDGGWSSVNVEGREFSFMVGDTRHPESALVYETISGLQNHMQDSVCDYNSVVST